MKVVITEKPSVARDIASVLKITEKKNGYIEGRGCAITWAFGHLVRIATATAATAADHGQGEPATRIGVFPSDYRHTPQKIVHLPTCSV